MLDTWNLLKCPLREHTGNKLQSWWPSSSSSNPAHSRQLLSCCYNDEVKKPWQINSDNIYNCFFFCSSLLKTHFRSLFNVRQCMITLFTDINISWKWSLGPIIWDTSLSKQDFSSIRLPTQGMTYADSSTGPRFNICPFTVFRNSYTFVEHRRKSSIKSLFQDHGSKRRKNHFHGHWQRKAMSNLLLQ
jgi:hypothetical protein